MIIKISDLDKLITITLSREYTSEETEFIKEVIRFGELSGRPTHGIIRLIKGNHGAFVDGKRGKPEFIRKTKVSTVIDGHGNPGMLVAPLAMQEAIRIAKSHGIGIVGTKGSFNSIGALSYYCNEIVEAGFLAILLAQASPAVAPFHTTKPLFGTNPIAFGIPSDPPIIFDMSTSAVTLGAIMKAKAEGKQIPANTAIDAEGGMTTDPNKVKATLPFDNNHKGSGIAMMIELLGSLWPGAGFQGLHTDDGNGNLFLVMSPDLVSDRQTIIAKTKEFVSNLKSTPTTDGKPVRIPGEQTISTYRGNLAKGEIEVSDVIFSQL